MGSGFLETRGLPELEIGQDRWVNRPARYLCQIQSAEPGQTGKGADKVVLRGSVEEQNADGSVGINNGVTFFDHIAINGETAQWFKKKLRQLGVPVEQDGISLVQICQTLVGQRFFVDLDLEEAMKKGPNGVLEPKTMINGQGQVVKCYQSKPTAYYSHAIGGQPQAQQVVAAPVAPIAPQFVQQAAPAAPAYAAPVQAAPQMAPQAGFGAPNGFGAPAGGPTPWQQPVQAAPAQVDTSGGGKRGKK